MVERRAFGLDAGGVRASATALAMLILAALLLLVAPPAGAEASAIPSSESAVSELETQAEEVEAELAQRPHDAGLLAKLTRTRVDIANTTINEGVGNAKVVGEVRHQLALAAGDWSRYLKATKKPSAELAVVVAPALFQLGELSKRPPEAFKRVKSAAAAEKIVAEARPSVDSWSTLAFYELFAQRYHAADEALAKALTRTHIKYERESLEKRFKEVEKNAKQFGKQLTH
jgi:hypothetical protein